MTLDEISEGIHKDDAVDDEPTPTFHPAVSPTAGGVALVHHLVVTVASLTTAHSEPRRRQHPYDSYEDGWWSCLELGRGLG
jgi:hypothetical protein